jgi:transcriptional regulator with XRE-family HTH domain
MKSKGAVFTFKQKQILKTLGETLRLARLRRKFSVASVAERAGLSESTMRFIEKGSPSVSLGSYMQVLIVLRLEEDILLIGANDPLGRHIQDADLIVKKRAPKKKKPDIETSINTISTEPTFE